MDQDQQGGVVADWPVGQPGRPLPAVAKFVGWGPGSQASLAGAALGLWDQVGDVQGLWGQDEGAQGLWGQAETAQEPWGQAAGDQCAVESPVSDAAQDSIWAESDGGICIGDSWLQLNLKLFLA